MPISLNEPVKRWQALGVLALSVFLGTTSWFSALAVLPQLSIAWSLSSSDGLLLTIAVQLGFVTGSLISALFNLADLLPPRRMILLGTIGAAVANGALVVSTGPKTALPLRFVTGASLALVYSPGLKAVATWFHKDRGAALGVMVGALTVGSALPHLIDSFGGATWQVVFIATSLLTLLGGWLAESVATDGPFPFPKAVLDLDQTAQAFANRHVRLATVGYLGHMWELYGMWTWFRTFFEDVLLQHSITNARQLAAITTFIVIGIGALGCWLAGLIGDRWGHMRTAALALGTSGTCALLIGFKNIPVLLVLALSIVWGFWVIADAAQFFTITTEVADQSYVGTTLTLQLALGYTLTVFTIWLVPAIDRYMNWHLALASLALGPVVGLIAMFRLMRSLRSNIRYCD